MNASISLKGIAEVLVYLSSDGAAISFIETMKISSTYMGFIMSSSEQHCLLCPVQLECGVSTARLCSIYGRKSDISGL